ncbi:MAG: hypothetical protein ACPLZF_00390 [Nitrososphaeria archaeon]
MWSGCPKAGIRLQTELDARLQQNIGLAQGLSPAEAVNGAVAHPLQAAAEQ